jgi:hypothetical protein
MALTQTQVSQLYITLFGRASEGAGNTYWQSAEDLASTANIMLATDAAATYFGTALDTDQAFIEHIYLNTLNKTVAQDPDGIAYWVGRLEAGDSRGDVTAQLINAVETYAGSTDPVTLAAYNQFVNRVAVSNYTADTIEGADLDPADADALAVFSGYIDGVTDDDSTVTDAMAAVDADANPVEEFTLTVALNDLAAAQDAETALLEGLDDLDTNLDGTDDVDAGDAVAGDITSYYSNASALMGTATTVTGFSTRSDALQDAAIATTLADFEDALATETADAADGMAGLLAAADAESETVVAAQEAKLETAIDLTAETAAFDSANGGPVAATVIFDEDYDSTADNSLNIIIVNGVAFTGEDGTVTPVPLADLTADETVLRVAALQAAYDADVAAAATLAAAKITLESAVEAVVLAETEAFSVFSLGSVVTYNDVAATVALDYSAADILVFDTEALADADAAGVKEEFTVTYAATWATGDEAAFDGTTVTLGATQTTVAMAALTADASYTNWTAVDNGDSTVTFTAKVGGVVDDTDYDAAGFVIMTAGDGTGATAQDVDGIAADAGTGTTTETVPNALALEGAISALEGFQELKAAFEEARELNDTLTDLQAAITAAEEAIENDVDDADAPGLGLNLETFENGAAATANNDVYLFDDDEATVAITAFGTTGEDTIFFGTDYTLVELTDGDTITDAVGDAAALEIFWEVQGGNLVLFVEEETFAGNGSTAADTVKITLAGVTADEFTFDGGFLTSGTAV